MYITQIRRVLVAIATLVTLAAFAPAHAAGFQISDPSGACGSWSWTQATATLTCNAATQPLAGAPPPPPAPPAPPPPSTGGGGAGAGGGISCAGFDKTIVKNLNYSPGVERIADVETFGKNDIVVTTFTTPANVGGGGWISVAEYGGPTAKRMVALTTTACSFSAPYLKIIGGMSPYLGFSGTGQLQPNTTYYLNVKNETCGASNCPIRVKMQAQ